MKKTLISGAGVLTLVGFLSKILAALYRFPYQNMVGDKGFYAFQQVYPFYSIITTLSLVALPNFLSSLRHTSQEADEMIKKRETQQFFQTSFLFSLASVILLSILCQPLAQLMGQPKLALPLLMAISPIILVPFLSLYRGLAQSKNDMTKSAISQMVEQVVRVVLIILAAFMFTRLTDDVYTISFLAMLGSFIGGLAALIYLIRSTNFKFKGLFTDLTDWQMKKEIIRKFGLASLIFTFFMIYMLIFQMVDVFFVKNALVHSGISSSHAEILKGIYDRGQPFLQLGLVITTAILTDALPKMTQGGHISKQIVDAVTYLSIALTVGLVLVLPEMNDVLFKSHTQALSLQLFIMQIPIISMIQLAHHELFLRGHHKISGAILLVGLLFKLLLVYPLTVTFGLAGASISSLISLLIVLVAYQSYRRRLPKQVLNLRFWLAILVMSAVVLLGKKLFDVSEHRVLQLIELLLLTAAGAATFFSIFRMKNIRELL
ncbi:oligosaccharide flippase family protein [Lactococcus insecticola]|uniref:Polysaccharide biosynthesis protein n=1 Tax=Pseudolactococcus insecticola TaxID=2709158 RepID=A0A6A0B6V0_9LACT|nr:oligosaccharide flippase family protein [Lactococcus insecticola]GFH40495.1 polysaccharide biosynthesis protein [Lactococcus insecticola]